MVQELGSSNHNAEVSNYKIHKIQLNKDWKKTVLIFACMKKT